MVTCLENFTDRMILKFLNLNLVNILIEKIHSNHSVFFFFKFTYRKPSVKPPQMILTGLRTHQVKLRGLKPKNIFMNWGTMCIMKIQWMVEMIRFFHYFGCIWASKSKLFSLVKKDNSELSKRILWSEIRDPKSEGGT